MGSFWFSALDVWVRIIKDHLPKWMVSAPVGSSKLMESVQLDIWSKSDPKESKETAESTIIPLYLTAYSHIQSHIDGLFNGGFLKTEYPQIIHFSRFSLRNQLFSSNPIYGNPQMMPHPSTHHEIFRRSVVPQPPWPHPSWQQSVPVAVWRARPRSCEEMTRPGDVVDPGSPRDCLGLEL